MPTELAYNYEEQADGSIECQAIVMDLVFRTVFPAGRDGEPEFWHTEPLALGEKLPLAMRLNDKEN